MEGDGQGGPVAESEAETGRIDGVVRRIAGVAPGLVEGSRRIARMARIARTAVRVGARTGLLPHTVPRGVPFLVSALVRNRSTPSTVYRLQALSQPRKVALRAGERAWTFAQIDEEIGRLAAGLRDAGLARGGHAALMMRNRPEFLFAQPALSRIGAAGVNVSRHATPQELVWIANHGDARVLLFDHELADTVRVAIDGMTTLSRERMYSVGGRVQGFPAYEQLVAGRPFPHGDEVSEQAAVIVYTSGTTGTPKAAIRRFPHDVVQGTLDLLSVAPLRADDVHLAVLPFYHSTAFAFTSFSHLVGACVVILDEFTPEGFLSAVQRWGVTQTAVVPTMLHRIVELGSERIAQWNTRSLRAIISCGAPLGAALASRVTEQFGEILYNFYGSTETGLNTMATPSDLRRSPGTIGRAIPGNEIRLLGEDGREVRRGEVGELYARSGLMVAGYLNDDASTREAMRGGGFSVGDLARIDARGCYHLVGRKRELIISGGVNVYPSEIEAVIEGHPMVREAAVVGKADDEWGERVCAFVVLASGAGEQEALGRLGAYCRERLSGPKRPRELVVVDALPRNATGKVLKTELRDRVG